MTDFIDDFLNSLDEDKSNFKEGFSDRIQKLFFSFEDNHGIVIFAPFLDKITGKVYVSLKGVKEYKMTCSKYKNGEDATWVKILPKQAYGKLTDDQSKLYDEAVSLWEQVNNEIGDKDDSFNQIRIKTYSLFQGILLMHRNLAKQNLTDNVNKAVLLIFPGNSAVNALAAAIESKMGATNSKEWMAGIFSPNATGREGAVVINFGKKTDGGFGYQSTVSFEMNSTYNKVVDDSAFVKEEVDKLNSMVPTFLGWQSGEDEHPFDSKVFEELVAVLKLKLKALDNPTPAPATEAPEIKNGVDPMLTPTPAPSQATEAQAAAPGGKQYPF